jgi:Tfp pilus assembly protein PilX
MFWPMHNRSRSGMALYIVLSVLIVVSLVAGMFLNLILSQSTLTQHQVSRTQAYFAGRMGMNYAIEMLRQNDTNWPPTGVYNRTICRTGCTKNEPDLPAAINNITISVGPVDAATGIRPINVSVNY